MNTIRLLRTVIAALLLTLTLTAWRCGKDKKEDTAPRNQVLGKWEQVDVTVLPPIDNVTSILSLYQAIADCSFVVVLDVRADGTIGESIRGDGCKRSPSNVGVQVSIEDGARWEVKGRKIIITSSAGSAESDLAFLSDGQTMTWTQRNGGQTFTRFFNRP
jgi:hypothetical protein